jgi:hypothetical protein
LCNVTLQRQIEFETEAAELKSKLTQLDNACLDAREQEATLRERLAKKQAERLQRQHDSKAQQQLLDACVRERDDTAALVDECRQGLAVARGQSELSRHALRAKVEELRLLQEQLQEVEAIGKAERR